MKKIKNLKEIIKIIKKSNLTENEKKIHLYDLDGHGIPDAEAKGDMTAYYFHERKKPYIEIHYYFSNCFNMNHHEDCKFRIYLVKE